MRQQMKIGIVTDSTADLSPELVKQYEIEIVPLTVNLQGKEYRDGVDITSDEFYRGLRAGGVQPFTSQPSPGAFIEAYRALLTKFDAVISIHLTELLSGTVRTARLVRDMMPDARIQVIDSGSTSLGLGGLVLEAAQAVKRGIPFNDVVTLINQLREKVYLIAALDTLEYVCKGGRVSKVQAFLGSLLRIKPLLMLKQGEVEVVAKVRSHREAVLKLLEDFRTQFSNNDAVISVVHTAAEEEGLKLKAVIQETFGNIEIMFAQAGPVLGSHLGPGVLALIGVPRG
jgi:DegV family protein with EDD domain